MTEIILTTRVISRTVDVDDDAGTITYDDSLCVPLDRIGEILESRYGDWGRWRLGDWGEVVGYRRRGTTDRRGRPTASVVTVRIVAAHERIERGCSGRPVELADLRVHDAPRVAHPALPDEHRTEPR